MEASMSERCGRRELVGDRSYLIWRMQPTQQCCCQEPDRYVHNQCLLMTSTDEVQFSWYSGCTLIRVLRLSRQSLRIQQDHSVAFTYCGTGAFHVLWYRASTACIKSCSNNRLRACNKESAESEHPASCTAPLWLHRIALQQDFPVDVITLPGCFTNGCLSI